MPYYATLSKIPSVYDNNIIGYAVPGFDFDLENSVRYLILYATVLVASNFIVLGLSTPVFVAISESIETTNKGKPKLYYHFWSAIILIIGGLWGHEIIYRSIKFQPRTSYAITLLTLIIVISFFGTILALLANGRKIRIFSVPLSGCRCCSKCVRRYWSYFMTIIGLFFTISFIAYLLFATPTIVLVYYLYPARTLIRVPFIIGAIFYTIALQSLVLYQFEKVMKILCYDCIDRCRPLPYNAHEEARPLVETHTQLQNSYGNQHQEVNNARSRSHEMTDQLCCCNVVDDEHTEEQHTLDIEYYTEKLKEDLQFVSSNYICHAIVAIVQLLAGIIILIAVVYGEIVLATLVFRQTTNTDTNSLLALLPTLAFSIFAWFGRSLIFDVREDIKELNIPYFEKKESTEEKILKAINELLNLQRSRIEQENQKRTTEEATLGDRSRDQGHIIMEDMV